MDGLTAFKLIGIAVFLAIASEAIIYPAMYACFRSLKLKDLEETHTLAACIGAAERTFYSLAVFYNAPAAIAGWLAMKAFSNHDPKYSAANNCTTENNVTEIECTKKYYAYLLGNILSLLLGVISGVILKVYLT